MQSPRTQPKPKAVVDQDLHPTRTPVGKEIRVMRPRLAEHPHHLRQRRVRAGAHIKRLDRKPRGIDADHTVSSRSHVAHAPAALVGHSIVIRVPPLQICTRIARSVGEPGSAGPPPSGTGRKPAPESGNELRSVARAASGNADAARLIHTRSMFAFNCKSNATAATDAPGRRHAAMAAALNAAVCRRRRRFSLGCISVHLQISGHYRYANSPTPVDDFAGRLPLDDDEREEMGVEIVEGDRPGSNRCFATLQIDIKKANKAAEKTRQPFRFRRKPTGH
jgi:hypothetical protein